MIRRPQRSTLSSSSAASDVYKRQDHSSILELLEKLKLTKVETYSSELKLDSEFVISLHRHAAKYSGFENSKLHLPLIVHPIENRKSGKGEFYSYRYSEAPIETLLDSG